MPAFAKSLRVLVIDDAHNALFLALLLQSHGHETAMVRDGAAAALFVRSRRPDVLIVDLGMPGEDGYAVARRLQPLFDIKPLWIALTGYPTDALRKRSRAVVFDHHLVKPVEPDELLQLLRDRAGKSGGI
jgi:two-component system CheB/CheR fusion protein